ncbi:MAG: Calx-beta domain-containing protein, partial [Cyclobacteriaceae bacterium]
VTFTAPADLCIDAGVQAGLGGSTPNGGVFSGPGVTDDGNGMTYSFDPAAAGVGTHTITYDFTDTNGCSNSASDDIEVFDLPVVTFTAPADLCRDAGVQAGLGGGTPTGGVYSGAGVTDDDNGMTYSFDPASAGVGTHTITYTFTDANSCTNTATDDIAVDQVVVPDAGPDQNICGSTTNLAAVFSTGSSGSWSITSGAGGSLGSSTSSTSSFSGAFGVNYTLEWTEVNGACSGTDEVIITFYDDPTVASAGTDQNIGSALTTTTTSLAANAISGFEETGTWAVVSGDGNGVVTGPTDPVSSFSGRLDQEYTLRWTSSNGVCTDSSDDVVVEFFNNAGFTIAETSGTTEVSEDGTTDEFTVILDSEPEGDVVLNIVSSDINEVTVDLASLTFTSVDWNIAQTVTLTGVDDLTLDSDKLVNISITVDEDATHQNYDNVGDQAVSVTNLNTTTAAITIADITIAEDTDEILITASLDNAVEGGFTVEVSTADGTALEADPDYTALVGEVLTFVGEAGETQTFAIADAADNKVEPDEDLTISLDNLSTSLPVDITDDALITLTNDDAASILLSSAIDDEDDGAITITARLNNPVQDPDGFTVVLSTANGTATLADDDYRSASQTLSFSGAGDQSIGFTVAIEEDDKLEVDETIRVVQSSLTGALLPVAITSQGIITIRNDDEATVTLTDVTVKEDGGPITMTAVLDNAVDGGFSIDIVSTDGTASSIDDDYTSIPGQTLSFDGDAGEEVTFIVTPTTDNLVEKDETFTIGLTNLDDTDLDVNIADVAQLSLVNDDSALVSIVGTMDAIEDNVNGVFTITSDHPIAEDISLNITIGGTASANVDYDLLASTYTLPAGATELAIPLMVLADKLVESEESVTISLDTIEVASVRRSADRIATILITDDDHLPVITAGQSFSIDEDAAVGASLGVVAASDEDDNTTFQDWQITSGNEPNVFSIDASSGELTVLDDMVLDFEITPSYVLTLTVSDGLNTSAVEQVTIKVQDASLPSVVLFADVAEVTNSLAIQFTAEFSEVMTGVAPDDVSITNGQLTDFATADDRLYTFTVVPNSDGTVVVTLPTGSGNDAAGNPSLPSNQVQFFFDRSPPVATLSTSVAEVSNEETATVLIDFNELVSGLATEDFELTNAEIADLSGSGAAYQIDVRVTEGTVEIGLKTGAVIDQAGNESLPSTVGWMVDTSAPTEVTIEVDAEAINTLNEGDLDIEIDAGDTEGTFTVTVTSEVDGSTVEGTGTLVDGVAVISGLDVSSLPDGPLTIAVVITDTAGNVSAPVTTSILKDTEQEIPQGFSPNGDGVGDVWIIPGIEKEPNNTVTIFNRYGAKVWEIASYDNDARAWDSRANVSSTFGSSSLPDGDYFYVIRFTGSSSRTKSGFVVLRR